LDRPRQIAIRASPHFVRGLSGQGLHESGSSSIERVLAVLVVIPAGNLRLQSQHINNRYLTALKTIDQGGRTRPTWDKTVIHRADSIAKRE
jgi:hypothetical protein